LELPTGPPTPSSYMFHPRVILVISASMNNFIRKVVTLESLEVIGVIFCSSVIIRMCAQELNKENKNRRKYNIQ
jgi:hypothetical protein